MPDIVGCLQELRTRLGRHRKQGLNEASTRVVFVNPLLKALGWDVEDVDQVQHEFTTIDGKLVDYALKMDGKPVVFVEAKAIADSLSDMKGLTQVIGYAANAGVDWCVLTNGVVYRVYCTTEKAEAPDKLLFEVSIEPKDTVGKTLEAVAKEFGPISEEGIRLGTLRQMHEHVFTTTKVKRALEKLLSDTPTRFIKIIRETMNSDVTPNQIKEALHRITVEASAISYDEPISKQVRAKRRTGARRGRTVKADYDEGHHLSGIPRGDLCLARISA